MIASTQKRGKTKMAITITIDDQRLGLDDFVQRWTWGLNSLPYLGNDMDEHMELSRMQDRVRELAVKRFFKLYEKEQQEYKNELE
jgi:hypothetical protein